MVSPRRSLLFFCAALGALVSGCDKPIDRDDAGQLRVAAEVAMLPHVVPDRRTEILGSVRDSELPAPVKKAALSGDPSEEMRAARIVLSQLGAGKPDVNRRIDELSRLVNGVTARSMGSEELKLVEPWLEARMHWAAVDGGLLLGRGSDEVGQLTGGVNLSKSPGLTRHGAEMVREMVHPILQTWKSAPVSGFSADVRYISALFGARESVEAAVVIFSVLTVVGLSGSGRVRRGKIAAGAALAVAAAFATGLFWNALIQAGTLGGGKQLIFVSFGLISIAMFLLIGSAVFHPVYFGRWMSKLREIGRADAGRAAVLVSFLAVYREGFEMSLSMTTLSMIGGWSAVAQGLGVGIPAGVLMVVAGWKIHRGWIGVRGMLVASGAMMVLAAASFSALFVNYLEQQGTISPLYIIKGVPVAVTVFTGLSGSLQTLLAFAGVGGALVIPWVARRLRCRLLSGAVNSGGGGWLNAGRVGGVVTALAGIGALTGAGGTRTTAVESIGFAEAVASARGGKFVLVDSRDAGSSPAIEGAIGLPMDNDDASIREFCDFTLGKAEVLVIGPDGKGEEMARRIGLLCGIKTKNVLWGSGDLKK